MKIVKLTPAEHTSRYNRALICFWAASGAALGMALVLAGLSAHLL